MEGHFYSRNEPAIPSSSEKQPEKWMLTCNMYVAFIDTAAISLSG